MQWQNKQTIIQALLSVLPLKISKDKTNLEWYQLKAIFFFILILLHKHRVDPSDSLVVAKRLKNSILRKSQRKAVGMNRGNVLFHFQSSLVLRFWVRFSMFCKLPYFTTTGPGADGRAISGLDILESNHWKCSVSCSHFWHLNAERSQGAGLTW